MGPGGPATRFAPSPTSARGSRWRPPMFQIRHELEQLLGLSIERMKRTLSILGSTASQGAAGRGRLPQRRAFLALFRVSLSRAAEFRRNGREEPAAW